MQQHFRRFSLAIAVLVLAFPAFAATSAETAIEKANALHQKGSFAEAFELLDQAGLTSTDTVSKTAVSDALVAIGVSEYGIRNFKNAWECFRTALKLRPTNQVATQYYLKMKKEMDTTKLANEAKPAPAASKEPAATASDGAVKTETAAAAATSAAADAAALAAANAAAAAAKEERERSDRELKAMLAQLQSAQASLASAESNANSSKSETAALQSQLQAQAALVEKLITAQQAKPAQVVASTSSADAKIIQRSLDLLSQMAEKQSVAASPQVIVQQDPELGALLKNLDSKMSADAQRPATDPVVFVALIAVLALLIAGAVFIVVVMLRARRQKRTREYSRQDSVVMQATPGGWGGDLIAQDNRTTALLEFVASSPSETGVNQQDLAIRKSLIKADRLQKMYDEIRSGTISWDTVRLYIDELEGAIKSDILKLVESKLNTGDLVSHEAILPIIFPFLNDYDDFLRHKAEKLARLALSDATSSQNPDGTIDPFSVKELMAIPQQLTKLLKGRDKSLITANISRAVAKDLGLAIDECQKIYKGALAHDAGYLTLDKADLQRILGQSEISEEDFDLIKSHAVKGLQYFGELEVPEYIKEAILMHHERKDGSGYPNGSKGAEIPLSAQIIGAAETFAALISHRDHRDKVEVTHAIAILKDAARTKFERTVIDSLIKVVNTNGGF